MAPTEVMMLGQLPPLVRTSFMNPLTTSPLYPQNLLRPSVMSGLGATPMARLFRFPRAPRAPRFPGFGQVTVMTPGITAARVAFPMVGPGQARVGFRTPYAGPGGGFVTPGLSPGAFALGSLGRGLARAKAIAIGQIDESIEGTYEDTVDEALAAYDTSLNEADAVLTPQEMEAEILASETDAPGPGEAVMLPGTSIQVPQSVVVGGGLLATVSALASLYHGYKRNERKGTGPALGWGLVWFFMGASLPPVALTVAWAQGFGKSKGR